MSKRPDNFNFSETHAQKRQKKANEILGESVVNRILAFALFLFGGKRDKIAKLLDMPMGTLLSFLTRINTHGLNAFEDGRFSPAENLQEIKMLPKCNLSLQEKNVCIQFGNLDPVLKIPKENQLQAKTVLFTLLKHRLLSTNDAAGILDLSNRRVRDLNAKMQEEDVSALIDKRIGQQEDYRFNSETKSELVQQFTVNAISGQSTSSRKLAEDIKDRCDLILADRSIRDHVRKLGLSRIRKTLPELVDKEKKNY